MRDIRNILIIRPSSLGDVCRSVPVLASLRRANPDARIDWLVHKEYVDVIWHHPALSEPVLFDRRGIGRALKKGNFRPLSALIGKLRQAKYDAVIDVQGLARSGFLARASGARHRIGYAPPEARELAWVWYTRRVRVDPAGHTVDNMMALAKALGADGAEQLLPGDMRLYTGPVERATMRQALASAVRGGNDLPRRYVVLAPTSRWPGKCWPANRFAALTERLLREGVDGVVVVGGTSEATQCMPLLHLAANDPRIINLIGRTSIGELMALIEGADLVVANDSAALQMAVGFERPLVALFGATRIASAGPYGRPDDVIQHVQESEASAATGRDARTGDYKNQARGSELMSRITVEEVAAACLARLRRGPG